MSSIALERRTAMYHAQREMGALMADANGWQLPLQYGDIAEEARWLRETVGVSDVSPIGKVKVVGEVAAQTAGALIPLARELTVGAVAEVDSTLPRGGKLLSACLSSDEFLLLTPTGEVPSAIAAMPTDSAVACAHAIDVTSALAAISFIGPATEGLISRITELDVSPRALPDLSCVQSRFAEVQGLLIRRDVHDAPIYQLYFGREFGEYLWEVLVETAHELGGGPVGTQALSGLRHQG